MNIPKGFASEKQKKEIEDIVRKTLVKEILVEDLAQKLESYLESKETAKRINIHFKKYIDITKNKKLKMIVQREVGGLRSEHDIFLPSRNYDIESLPRFILPCRVYDHIKMDRNYSSEEEIRQITERIKELDPNIKEEETICADYCTLDIVSEEFIYQLKIDVGGQIRRVDTSEKAKVGRVFKRTVPVTNMYHNKEINGYVTYVKFNKEHHKKITQVLKEKGYDVSLIIH